MDKIQPFLKFGLGSINNSQFELYNHKMKDPLFLKTQIRGLPDENKLEQIYNQKAGIVGLDNLGNSCYFNSIIQCLVHTPSLTKYLFGEIAPTYMIRNLSKATNNEQVGQIALTVAYIRTVIQLWSITNTPHNPITLKIQSDHVYNQYKDRIQHDAHEYLVSFLNGLHESLSRKVKYTLTGQPITQYDRKIQKSRDDWAHYYKGQHSEVLDLFGGQLQTQTICNNCNHPTYTFDPFLCLDLTLPTNISHSVPYNLYECLNKYTDTEDMYGDNKYNCDHCHTKSDAFKVNSMWKLPSTFVIKLSRFQNNFINGQYHSHKIANLIHYPVTGLDLSQTKCVCNSSQLGIIYDLYAVVCHSGTMQGGHYYSYVYNHVRSQWLCYNDRDVAVVTNLNQLITSDAYILFYQKRE